MVDEFVGAVLNNVPPRTAVIMISDHGQVPVKKIVHINGILYNRGYIAVDEAFRVDVRGTKAYAPWHSHVFINLAGREAQGVVRATEHSSLVEEVVRMLREYRDPDTGERVFDLVLTREEAEILGLGGERTGDIVFALKPGYTSSTALVRDRATGKAVEIAPATPLVTVTGDHGPHLPHYKELHGVFLAVGPGISGGYLGAVSSLQVAPTIAALLGIKPPSDSKHSSILTVKEVKTTITATVTNVLTTTMVTTREVTRTTALTDVRTTTMVEQRTATVFNTLTLTSPVTVTESRLDVGTAGLVAIAMLLAGLVVGFLVFRKG
jgi:predicted AlkP superfamily phosphohydrolase/phosphomutase